MRRLHPALLCLALLVSACGVTPPKPEPGSDDTQALVDYGRALVEREIRQRDIPGLSLVLVDRDSVLWAEAFGWASRNEERPLTTDTGMMTGSVTKLFTALAIVQLSEQGKLDLDAPLRHYLPDLAIQSRFGEPEFSVRQVLSHHAGLPSDRLGGLSLYGSARHTPRSQYRNWQQLPAQLADSHLVNPPGRVRSYSNLGYSLLGLVVERVSGQRYPDYIDQHLLQPVGMTSAGILHKDNPMSDRLARGFTHYGEIEGVYTRDMPAASLVASAEDLGRFMQVLLRGGAPLLQEASLQAMFSPQNEEVALDGDLRMGLGFNLSGFAIRPGARLSGMDSLAGHDGNIAPYHTQLILLPEAGLGIAVLTNSNKGQSSVRRLADSVLAAAYESRSGQALAAAPRAEPIRLSREEAAQYAGYYAAPFGLVKLHPGQTRLRLETALPTRGLSLYLRPLEDELFDLKARLWRLLPVPARLLQLDSINLAARELEGENVFWLSHGHWRLMPSLPVSPPPVPDAWQARLGVYEPADPEDSNLVRRVEISFDRKTGFLQATAESSGGASLTLPLEALDDTLAILLGAGRNLGEAVQARPDGSLHYSGMVFVPVE